jgi:hypothetical protein
MEISSVIFIHLFRPKGQLWQMQLYMPTGCDPVKRSRLLGAAGWPSATQATLLLTEWLKSSNRKFMYAANSKKVVLWTLNSKP